jgi:hypothetical protein
VNIADLIAELSRYPGHMPVKVVLSEVITLTELGEFDGPLCDEDSIIAAEVVHKGDHILIRSA